MRCLLKDPWWNPAVEEQAVMRIHRIGQTKTVSIRRFIVKVSFSHQISSQSQFIFSWGYYQNIIRGRLFDILMPRFSCYLSVLIMIWYGCPGHRRRTHGGRAGSKAAIDFWSFDWPRSPHCTYRRTEDAFLLRRQKGCWASDGRHACTLHPWLKQDGRCSFFSKPEVGR